LSHLVSFDVTLCMLFQRLPAEDSGGWGLYYDVEYRQRPPRGQEDGNYKWFKVSYLSRVDSFEIESKKLFVFLLNLTYKHKKNTNLPMPVN